MQHREALGDVLAGRQAGRIDALLERGACGCDRRIPPTQSGRGPGTATRARNYARRRCRSSAATSAAAARSTTPVRTGVTTSPPPLTTTSPTLGIPSGYAGYDPSFGVRRDGFRLGGLARAIEILMIVLLVASAASALVLVANRSRFGDFVDGTIEESDVESAIAAVGLIGFVTGACQLAVAVCVMIWMWRAAKNLRLAGRTDTTWAPGWGIAGWFCPPCVFVIPWLMLQELWKGASPDSPAGPSGWRSTRAHRLIPVWWVLYGLGGLVVAGLQLRRGFAVEIEDVAEFYDDAAWWTLASTAVTIAAGICFIVVVRGITARQRQLIGE